MGRDLKVMGHDLKVMGRDINVMGDVLKLMGHECLSDCDIEGRFWLLPTKMQCIGRGGLPFKYLCNFANSDIIKLENEVNVKQ